MLKIISLAIISFSILLSGCSSDSNQHYNGYIEADYTYVAPYANGQLTHLLVAKGQMVKTGQLLFTLNAEPNQSQLNRAEAQVAQAQAQLKDLLTGERPAKLAVIIAQINQAQAQLKYAKQQFSRNQQLVASNSAARQKLDLATQNLKVANANLHQLQQSLVSAKLSARPEQIIAAQAALKVSDANLKQAAWLSSQRQILSPISAQVIDTFNWPGEQVGAAQPVLELLAPTQIKVLFFVPESRLSQLKLGQKIWVNSDGGKQAEALISYISPQAEFTPPVIYSRQTQTKLIYQIQARFVKNPQTWHPGQPIWVSRQL